MARVLTVLIILSLAFSCSTVKNHKKTDDLKGKRVLIFSYSNAYQHESRATAIPVITEALRKKKAKVYHTEDSSFFKTEILAGFDAVMFCNTGGHPLGTDGQSALVNYMKMGGGFVGIHGASATHSEWDWYTQLVGADFDRHPKIQQAKVLVRDRTRPSTEHFPEYFMHEDEWYNWVELPPEDVTVLLSVDEKSYDGGTHGENHPISWCREFAGGRSWYTALGHKHEHYRDADFIRHVLGGIVWVSE